MLRTEYIICPYMADGTQKEMDDSKASDKPNSFINRAFFLCLNRF